jgi:hypothetical protein
VLQQVTKLPIKKRISRDDTRCFSVFVLLLLELICPTPQLSSRKRHKLQAIPVDILVWIARFESLCGRTAELATNSSQGNGRAIAALAIDVKTCTITGYGYGCSGCNGVGEGSGSWTRSPLFCRPCAVAVLNQRCCKLPRRSNRGCLVQYMW